MLSITMAFTIAMDMLEFKLMSSTYVPNCEKYHNFNTFLQIDEYVRNIFSHTLLEDCRHNRHSLPCGHFLKSVQHVYQ